MSYAVFEISRNKLLKKQYPMGVSGDMVGCFTSREEAIEFVKKEIKFLNVVHKETTVKEENNYEQTILRAKNCVFIYQIHEIKC